MFNPEKLKLKQLLSEAILLLCRSALPFDSELSVQALVGVTCDQSDICLVSIAEVIKKCEADVHDEDQLQSSSVGSMELESKLGSSTLSLSQRSSNLGRESGDGGLTPMSSSPPAKGSSQNAILGSEKFHSIKKNLPGFDKNRENYQLAACSEDTRKKTDLRTMGLFSYRTKPAELTSYDIYNEDGVMAKKRPRLEHSSNRPSPQCELKKETENRKWRTRIPSFLDSDETQQSQQQQELGIVQVCSSDCERCESSSTDVKHTDHNALPLDAVEIKTEPAEDEDEDLQEEAFVKEEFTEVNFTDHFQDDGNSFSLAGICQGPYQFTMKEKNFQFHERPENGVSFPMNSDGSDGDQQLNVSITTLVCQQVLKYEGPFVTVRDIQRRRLRHVSANQIKSSMNRLTSDGLGFYKTLCLGIMVFYKCPPSLVDPNVLQKYNISCKHYEQIYNLQSYITSSNRHTDNYWERINMSSPYAQGIVQ